MHTTRQRQAGAQTVVSGARSNEPDPGVATNHAIHGYAGRVSQSDTFVAIAPLTPSHQRMCTREPSCWSRFQALALCLCSFAHCDSRQHRPHREAPWTAGRRPGARAIYVQGCRGRGHRAGARRRATAAAGARMLLGREIASWIA
jgi:hypothetical protein